MVNPSKTTSDFNQKNIIYYMLIQTLFNEKKTVSLSVSLFGAQITAGEINGDQIFFLSNTTSLEGPLPIRGGAPVCFPHFGKGTMMPDGLERKPSHGEVRQQIWNVKEKTNSRLILSLSSSEMTQNLETEITYETLENEISAQWIVRNNSDESVTFQAALHSYLKVSHVHDVTIKGLGNTYLDNLFNLSRKNDSPEIFSASSTPIDRVYIAPESEIEIADSRRVIQLKHKGFFNSVVWNPGRDHTLKDLSSWENFICVESCAVTPAPVLMPHNVWHGSLSVSVL